MINIVNALNIISAMVIIAAWMREKRKLPKRFARQMSLRYIRFFLVYAMMMNRYNRYHQWAAGVSGNTPVPYWPLTHQEKLIVIVYFLVAAIGFMLYCQYRSSSAADDISYRPFSLSLLMYPVMMPSLKMVKGRTSAMISATLAGLVYTFGWLEILNTMLFSMKNVH